MLFTVLTGQQSQAQNVGIGTNTPAEKLHVVGNIRSSNLSGTDTRSVFIDPNGTFTSNPGTAAAVVPAGTTAQRPSAPANGYLRYNTDLSKLEFYENGAWVTYGTATYTGSTGVTLSGSDFQLTGQALAFHNLATTGVVVRTGAGAVTTRSMTGTTNQITMTNGDGVSGNPTIAIANDPVLPGTGGVVLPVGTTAQRPITPTNGTARYNTTLNKFEYYENGSWVQLLTNNLANGQIWVGDASNVPVARTMSGDVTISNTAVATISNNAVTSAKILDGTIATADLANDAVTSAKILDGTVATADLANDAVTSAKILDGTIATADVANNAIDGTKIGIGTTAGDILYYDGADWQRLAAGTAGQKLQTNGAGAPTWATAPSGSGTLNYVSKWTPNGATLGNSQIFDNGTNVGIGTATPGTKLEIQTGAGTDYLQYYGNLSVYNAEASTGETRLGAAWDRPGVYSSSTMNVLSAGEVRLGAGGNNTHVTITTAGNVGIGTATPAAKTHIAGGGLIVGTNGTSSATRTVTLLNDGQAQVNFGSYPGAWSPALQIQNNDNTRYMWMSPLDNASGANSRLLAYNSGLDIYTGANAYSTTFASNGNVGIGVTSPGYGLELAGTFGYGNGNPATYRSRTETRDVAGQQGSAGAQSGFYETSTATTGENWPVTDNSWWHLMDARHSNSTNNYAMQIAGSFFDQNFYGRKTNNNAATAWRRFMMVGDGDYIQNQYSGAQSANHWVTGESRVGGWFRNSTAGNGLYNEATANHIYSINANYWTMESSNGLIFRNGYESTVQGYVYSDNGGSFGLLSPNGNWRFRADNTNTEAYGSGFYAPTSYIGFIYDRDNTGYYLDPNGSSQMSAVYANNWFRPQGNTGLYFQDWGGGFHMTDGTWIRTYNNKNFYCNTTIQAGNNMYSPIYYDLNDGNYYADPNNWSVFVHHRVNYQALLSYYGDVTYVGWAQGAPTYTVCNNCWPFGTDCFWCGSTTYHYLRFRVNGGGEASGWFTTSDEQFKTNIKTIPKALDRISKMRGVTYDLDYNKKKGEAKHEVTEANANVMQGSVGFIAQELQKVLPQVVQEVEDADSLGKKTGTTHLAVNYDGVIPVLVEAMKEQQAQIEQIKAAAGLPATSPAAGASLEATVDAMQKQLQQLQAQLDEIKNRMKTRE